jgi:uncharacterized protein (DUF1015 family)
MDFTTVAPAHVARPLRLEPFAAVMLAPQRVADPASARALARPYRDVAARLEQWIARGDAVAVQQPALFLHEYTSGGITVRGLVGALDVSERTERLDESGVWPHEAVHPEQVAELARRMEEMRLNPAPILLVSRGTVRGRELLEQVASTPPDWSYIDRAGQRQRLWAVRDAGTVAALQAEVASAPCLLADGHHRYAAYLQLQEAHPGTSWDHGLAMVVDQSDTPLFLGPIHRVVAGIGLEALAALCRGLAVDVQLTDRSGALDSLDPATILATDGRTWLSLSRPDDAKGPLVEWVATDLATALPDHAVVTFQHSVDEVLERAGDSTVGLILPAMKYDDIFEILTAGELLPEKATSFQPKPSIGTIMRPVPE